MMVWLMLVFSAAINRLAGTQGWMGPLPGRPVWYAAIAFGAACAILQPPWIAAGLGAGFLIWRLPAWGRWFDLGRLPEGYGREGVEPDIFERFIGRLAGTSDHLALWLRHTIMLIPAFIWLAVAAGRPWLVLLAVPTGTAFLAAYEAAWRISPAYPIPIAEVTVGAMWGMIAGGVA